LFIEIYKDIKLIGRFKLVAKHKRVFEIILTIIGIYISLVWAIQIIFEESSNVSYYEAFKKMAGYPKDTILLINMQKIDNTIELVYEIKIQLSEFWDRSDIKVEYLDLHNLPKDKYIVVDSDRFLRGCSKDVLNSLYSDLPTNVSATSRSLVITTPLEIVKQSLRKTVNYLVFKRPITPDGIYTYYYNYNNWYFFNE